MNAAGVPDGTWLGAQEQKENENAEDPIVVDEDHENGEDNSGLSSPDDEFVCDVIDRRVASDCKSLHVFDFVGMEAFQIV